MNAAGIDARPREGRPRRPHSRRVALLAALAAALVLIAANGHLVYVAVTSQPECVDHLKRGDARPGSYVAARSAC